jgi:hypothetical protein
MKYMGKNKDGSTFPADALIGQTERSIIYQHPLIHEIIYVETGEVIWTRTIAYFPGDYDPGTKVLK